jgi:hypothetical protein
MQAALLAVEQSQDHGHEQQQSEQKHQEVKSHLFPLWAS